MADHEAHSDAFAVDLYGALEPAELLEEHGDFLGFDSLSIVVHLHSEQIAFFVVGHDDANDSIVAELEGVLHQIGKDLLQSFVVSCQNLRQLEHGQCVRV